jgi:hypothetical protein
MKFVVKIASNLSMILTSALCAAAQNQSSQAPPPGAAAASAQSGPAWSPDPQFPSIGSQKEGIVVNPDTSVDFWFGPTASKGHEANWCKLFQTRVGMSSCGFTGRYSPGLTRLGSLVSLNW